MSQVFILIIILGLPLAIPLYQKKWRWFLSVVIGYVMYVIWGAYLHFTSDITEYGTGYGMFIFPYIFFISLLGLFIQKSIKCKSYLRKNEYYFLRFY